MPNVILKDKSGTPMTYQNINTIKLKTPDGGNASFRYNGGSTYPPIGAGWRVRLFDYDGTLLSTTWVDEGDSFTPSDPVHEGLIFQGWNVGAEAFEYIDGHIDACAMYAPTEDGETAAAVTILRVDTSISLTGTLYIQTFYSESVRNILINWGDGSDITSIPGSTDYNRQASHTYADVGEYDIIITVDNPSGEIDYSFRSLGSNTVQFGGGVVSVILGSNASLGEYAFVGSRCLRKVIIPPSVTNIGSSSFNGCCDLLGITIPSSVTRIGVSAFTACLTLKDIVIPSSVTSIGENAFRNNGLLSAVSIPHGVTSIENATFMYCYGLRSVVIPASVTNIVNNAFYDCTIRQFRVEASTPPTLGSSGNPIVNKITGCKILVPPGTADAYKAATNWSSFASYIFEYDPNDIPEIL